MAALATEAKLMAEGDLTRQIEFQRRQIPVEAGDEVGRMGASLDRVGHFATGRIDSRDQRSYGRAVPRYRAGGEND